MICVVRVPAQSLFPVTYSPPFAYQELSNFIIRGCVVRHPSIVPFDVEVNPDCMLVVYGYVSVLDPLRFTSY
jgi:hypothetical protein